MTPLEELNQRVTDAIFRAERAPEGLQKRLAYAEVAALETLIADVAPAESLDAWVARRGAVTAWMSAGIPRIAAAVCSAYLHQPLEPDVRKDLGELLNRASQEAVLQVLEAPPP